MEDAERLLDGALREPRLVGDLAVAEPRGRRALPVRAPPEQQEDEERGGRAVVAGEVAQEDVDDVGVEPEGAAGSYHSKQYSRNRAP